MRLLSKHFFCVKQEKSPEISQMKIFWLCGFRVKVIDDVNFIHLPTVNRPSHLTLVRVLLNNQMSNVLIFFKMGISN